MSSTKRGAERRVDDLYETPEWFTRAIIPELMDRVPLPSNGRQLQIWEPACGTGRMVKVLGVAFGEAFIRATDIQGSPPVDFLQAEPIPHDLIVTNPPFSLALPFVQKALECRHSEQSVVAMVLRLNFLGSKRRAKWMRDNMPECYVSPRRPHFVPGESKSDSCEYAWFVWQGPPKQEGTIHLLHTEDVKGPMFSWDEADAHALREVVAKRRMEARNAAIPFG